MSFHEGATARIRIDGKTHEQSVDLNEGVLQGSNGGPLLFVVSFAAEIRQRLKELGINTIKYKVKVQGVWHERDTEGKFEWLGVIELMFADDAAVIAQSEEDMQAIAHVIEDVCVCCLVWS